MSQYNVNPQISLTAGAAILAGEAMKLSAANTVIPATNNTAVIIGFAVKPAASGEMVLVQVSGVAKAKAHDAITFGTRVTSGAAGRVDGVVGDMQNYIGVALESSAAQDDMIAVLITNGHESTGV